MSASKSNAAKHGGEHTTPRTARSSGAVAAGKGTHHQDVPSRIRPVARDLNFYLEYVIGNTPPGGGAEAESSQTQNQLFALTASRLLGKLSKVLHMRSHSFAQTFQPLVPAGGDENLKVEMRGGERHLDVKVLLKRPVYPNMFEVRTGHQNRTPKGCALYRIRKSPSQEEDIVMRRMYKRCLDKSGFVSPLKIYPWLAKAVLDAVVHLRENDNQWADLDFSLHATFPVIKMEVNFGRNRPRSNQSQTSVRSQRLASARSNRTLEPILDDRVHDSFTSRENNGRSPSHIEISRISRSVSVADSPTGLNTSRVSSAGSHRPNRSGRSYRSVRPPSTSAWSGSNFHEEDDNDDENVEPPPPGKLHINLIPTIEGFGWPKSTRVPQVVPNQRPWSLKAKQWTSELSDKLRQGASFWELTAFNPGELLPPDRPEYVPYWRLSLRKARDFLLSRVGDEVPFSATLDGIFDVLDMATTSGVGGSSGGGDVTGGGCNCKVWSFLGASTKDDIRVGVLREHLHQNRTLGEWYLAVLEATIRALEERKTAAAKERLGVQVDDYPMAAAEEEGNNQEEEVAKSPGTSSSRDTCTRLLETLRHVAFISKDDPRKLVELIQMNDPSSSHEDINDLHPPPLKRRSSTPVIQRRPSMIIDQTAIDTSATATAAKKQKAPSSKPQRNLYRLFRKDF